MASSSEPTMRVLTSKAKIERRALVGLRYVASTVSVSLQYEYVCCPRQLEPIPWDHIPYRLGVGLIAMPNESRVVTMKPFG